MSARTFAMVDHRELTEHRKRMGQPSREPEVEVVEIRHAGLVVYLSQGKVIHVRTQ